MCAKLEEALKGIALGEYDGVSTLMEYIDKNGHVYRTERGKNTTSPDPALIMELIDRQIGGEKDWC